MRRRPTLGGTEESNVKSGYLKVCHGGREGRSAKEETNNAIRKKNGGIDDPLFTPQRKSQGRRTNEKRDREGQKAPG